MATLFVGRLDSQIQSEELQATFQRFGETKRCDVKRGTSSNYAFIEYENAEDADSALKASESAEGIEIQGQRLIVEAAKGSVREKSNNECFKCGREGKSHDALTRLGHAYRI
ncbi:hypothetical protein CAUPRSCDRAFT_12565 [Caulochytrium protostelioides]|uniref:RRM domain-containing protein n=1 Tax=Caulochytrium protostelioides TaxID=1555241 RepID=A0A4P9WUJ1_9FUNG|nr:hypothetical protein CAUPRSCDRAFT_12565 [Caulochytrium protostelioides]